MNSKSLKVEIKMMINRQAKGTNNVDEQEQTNSQSSLRKMSSIQQLNTVEESSNSNNMFDRINQDGDSDSTHKSNSIVDSNTKYVNDKYVTKKKDKSKNTNNDIE
jgi:hypothetical protein